jgi:predicted nucleotide-binding protein
MAREKKAFVCFVQQEKNFFNLMRRFLRKNGIIAYDRNLYNNFNEKASRLFDPLSLDKELSHPDLALILLSRHFLDTQNKWFDDELRALYMLEQFRKTNFIVPVILDDVEDSEIPEYFKEQPDKYVDLRGKSNEEGLRDLVSHISKMAGGKIFIGHGHARDWKDLKDFLQDRLDLECDDFEAEPPAGKSIEGRLVEMLNDARFAFLVMTAEDEHRDSSRHARENVIHEVGLFQGKLGFERAIILLEEGCAEFSNKSGIVHIPFRRGEISACFEEIRRILEREGITS